MTKRAVLYARVSTDDQADKGYSLPSQLELCRKYAERLGFEIVGEMREDHSGATPIAERPEGKTLAAMLKSRQADAVIVYQVDRLSRDIVDLLASVRNWIRTGVEVHTCDIGKIESELDIVLVIKGWQGSDERMKIRERTMRGRNGKAQSGRVVGSGYAPYGYHYADGYFVIVEIEAGVVRLIYRWYVKGDGERKPMTAYAIARRLSEMRIAPPGDKHDRPRVRTRGMWNPGAVYRILTNETYAGVWRYGKREGLAGRPRTVGEQIVVSVPAIVDHDLWEQAQTRRDYNKQMSKRNAKREYLLKGRVRCGCGGAMVGTTIRRNYTYYCCARQAQRFSGLEDKGCHERFVRTGTLDASVWGYVENATKNAADFEGILRKAQEQEQESLEPKRAQLAVLHEQIAETEKEAVEISEALKKTPRGGVVEKNLLADIARVEKLYADQIKRRDELEGAIREHKLTDERIEAAKRFREDIVLGMKEPTFEDKREILEILNARVVVKGGRAVVTCYIPTEPYSIKLHGS